MDVCLWLNKDKNNNNFVVRYVNNMLVDANINTHVDFLQENIAQRFGFNRYSQKRFLVSSYDGEVNGRAERYLIVP